MIIKKFNQISKEDIKEVGGKGASLGELTQLGLPVPFGFVITTAVFGKFKEEEMPVEVKEDILQAFDELGYDRVAVRSSAIAEDGEKTSWAGQLETYLNVRRNELIEKVRDCLNSIKSERALSYAGQNNIDKKYLKVAVVIQKMIEAKASGVMFTVNPVSKDRNEVMIESVLGLGEALVQGLVTPDNFLIDKESLEIKSKNLQEISEQSITDENIKELVSFGKSIENHYQSPQDIEWTIDETGKIWILQSRPITTL